VAAAGATLLAVSLGAGNSQAAISPAVDCSIAGGTQCQVTFTDTSSLSDWTVPDATTNLHVVAVGGTGGSAGPDADSPGGKSNHAVQATFDAAVTPGSHISIANGSGGNSSSGGNGGVGGTNPLGGYSGGNGAGQGPSGTSGGGGGGGAATVLTIGTSIYVVGGSGGAGGGSWNIAGSDGLATTAPVTSGTSGGAGSLAAQDGGGGGGGGGGLAGGRGGVAGCDHPPSGSSIACEAAGVSAGGGYAGTSTSSLNISLNSISSTPSAGGYVVVTYMLSPLPSGPTITSFTTGDKAVLLHISPPAYMGASAINYYQYSLGKNVWNSFSLTNSDGTYIVQGLKNATRYTIMVRAHNNSGFSPTSNSVLASPTNSPPPAPKLIKLTAGDSQITVQYADSTSYVAQSIIKHEYSIDRGVTWNSTPTLTSPFTISGLVNGVNTYVQVRAIGSNGTGPSSARSSVKPGGPASAPSITSVLPASAQMSVAFTAPNNSGGHLVTNYQYSVDGGTTWIVRSPASVASPLVISGIPNGYAYQVVLRAVTSTGAGAISNIVNQNLEFGTPVLNLQQTQIIAGPTVFIQFANFTGVRSTLFSKMSFEIVPKSGSTTKAVSATFSKAYLVNNGYFDASAGTIKLPIFGLYSNYENTVIVRYFEGSILAKQMSITVTTQAWRDPYGPDALYKNPELIVKRDNSIPLDYSYFMLKATATGSSPVVIDTDGEVRWVGVKNGGSQSSIFYGNGMYVGNGTSINRTELDGRYKQLARYAASDDVTFLGHHNYDRGRDGILIEVNRSTETEAAILEIDPVTGSVLRTFDLATIIERNMLAFGDNPSGFVRRDVDFFHNNSAAYWAEQNTLVVSSRENFVIGIDYTTQQIKWILGDQTKLWYSYPSLRRYALTLSTGSVAPIGQHGVSMTSDGQLMLFDNGKESLVQSPAGASRHESVPRKYRIDPVAMTASETWNYQHDPVVHSPICSSIYQDGSSYLVNYASENLWQSTRLYVRVMGLDANKRIAFEYRYPGNWDTGWNASPLHLDGLVFD